MTATAHNPQAIEVVLYLDQDDIKSGEVPESGFYLTKLVGPRQTMGQMTNITYEASRGKFVMLMNDDVIFRTPDWDMAVGLACRSFSDEIALVYGNDLYQRGGVGTFPVLSRTLCQLMEGVCPPEYKCSHIDTHIYDIFRKLARLGHKRYIYLPEVIFEHMHFEVGKSVIDEIYQAKDPKVDEVSYIAWEEERSWMATRLAQYIEGHR
jgi:hypothetical protein